jgi:ribonuclease G
VLVTVDRAETRVAMLEAAGDPAPSKSRARGRRRKGGVPQGFRVAEVYFERRGGRSIVGNIYKGVVDNVLPGLEAAFVDIGLDKNGFLHVDEIVLPGIEAAKRGRGKESGPRITDLLRPGQEIVVQVVKDPLKTKGARLSMELTIAGRYMVYAPTGEGVGVSRRLDDKERDRLRKEAKQLDLGGGGAIIRTAAQGATRADFERELQYLFKLNEVLQKRVAEAKAPALVFQEADLAVRVVRDIASEHFERAILDDPKQHHRLLSFFSRTAPELVDRVEVWEDSDTPLFDAYGVEPVIEGMLSRRVDLPSGGYLMIDYAEALTVIDINTGSFTGKGRQARLEDTITKTNLEAAEEVVNQLRLRDIGGIIVIDFIDMARARNRDAVLKTLRKSLDEDRTKTFVVEISPLGLVEMTRQNVTDGVREIMTKQCPTCGGEGVVKSEETIAIDVERHLREIVHEAGGRRRRGLPRPAQPEGHALLHGRWRAHAARARGGDGALLPLRGLRGPPARPLRDHRGGLARPDHRAGGAVPRRARRSTSTSSSRTCSTTTMRWRRSTATSSRSSTASPTSARRSSYASRRPAARPPGRSSPAPTPSTASAAAEERAQARVRTERRPQGGAHARAPQGGGRSGGGRGAEAALTAVRRPRTARRSTRRRPRRWRLWTEDAEPEAGTGPAALSEAEPGENGAVDSKPRRRGRRGGRRRSRAKAGADAADTSDVTE